MKLNVPKPVKVISGKGNTIIPTKNFQPKSYEVQKELKIKISIQRDGEIEQKIKDLNTALKVKAQKVELNLITKFESDKGLLSFTTALIKIANSITYLRWRIRGAFTDDGQAKSIGDAIGRMNTAYRIQIYLEDTYFADTGAKSLANGLKKLQNLKVLKLDIDIMGGKIYKQLSDVGFKLLQASISQMPKCQIFESNLIHSSIKNMTKAQSNLIYDIYFDIEEINDREESSFNWKTLQDTFTDEMKQLSSQLTQIHLQNHFISTQFLGGKESFYYYSIGQTKSSSAIQKEQFFYNQVKCVFDLPYITNFKYNFNVNNELYQNPNSNYAIEIGNYNTTLKLLANHRYVQIHQLLVFQEQISNIFNINPVLLIVDLHID